MWRDVEALETFAFKTVHSRYYGKRAEWFEPHQGPYMVMWWILQDHRPDIAEAVEHAEDLLSNGDSDRAFGWPKRKAAA